MLTTRQDFKTSIGRVHRLYREEGLMVRRLKRKRLKGIAPSNAMILRPNQEWALDFVSDAFSQWPRPRALTHGGQANTRGATPARLEVDTGISLGSSVSHARLNGRDRPERGALTAPLALR